MIKFNMDLTSNRLHSGTNLMKQCQEIGQNWTGR